MAGIPFNVQTLGTFEARLLSLQPESSRQWGTMDLVTMLRHLRFVFEVSLGEQRLPDESWPVIRRAFYFLLFRALTNWPKGKIKAPAAFFPTPETDFEGEREALRAIMRRFAETARKHPEHRAVSTFLGAIPLREWVYVHGAHCNHHFRQYGV
ncbi:MAG: DUF1569 domain-containing protein [Candidatus Hydrogenedentes bacterium]|nr:DUF1569 domain-containing protein [Candidatus Hydrogenedentota bacterium]